MVGSRARCVHVLCVVHKHLCMCVYVCVHVCKHTLVPGRLWGQDGGDFFMVIACSQQRAWPGSVGMTWTLQPSALPDLNKANSGNDRG